MVTAESELREIVHPSFPYLTERSRIAPPPIANIKRTAPSIEAVPISTIKREEAPVIIDLKDVPIAFAAPIFGTPGKGYRSQRRRKSF